MSFAGFNSSKLVKGRLQAALYSMRKKNRIRRQGGIDPPEPSWKPSNWFAANENGLWLNFGNMAEIRQEATGDGLGALGQGVGAVFDGKYDYVRGPELIPNGDFSSNLTGWEGGNATISLVSGAMLITATTNGFCHGGYTAGITTVVGKTYEVVADFTKGTASTAYLVGGPNPFGTDFNGSIRTSSGQMRLIFKATATTMYVSLALSANSGETGTVDNFSMKLVEGNHAFQTNNPSCMILTADGDLVFADADGVDDGLLVSNTVFDEYMDVYLLMRRDSAAQAVTIWGVDTNQFAAVIQEGSTGSPDNNAIINDPMYRVNGVKVNEVASAITRGDLHTAMPLGEWVVLEVQGLYMELWTQLHVFMYSGFFANSSIAQLLVAPVKPDEDRLLARTYFAEQAGITLP